MSRISWDEMRFLPYIWEVFFIDNEKNSINFAIFPLEMLDNEKYNSLAAKDLFLYMLLLNRTNISKKNLKHFSDKNGIFVYYSNEQIIKHLKCNKNTVTQILNNLEAAGLIRKEYQKPGLPLKIYVNDVFGVHNRTYKKDKPAPDTNKTYKSPAPHKDKDVSFDTDKLDEMVHNHLFTFSEKRKRKPD